MLNCLFLNGCLFTPTLIYSLITRFYFFFSLLLLFLLLLLFCCFSPLFCFVDTCVTSLFEYIFCLLDSSGKTGKVCAVSFYHFGCFAVENLSSFDHLDRSRTNTVESKSSWKHMAGFSKFDHLL